MKKILVFVVFVLFVLPVIAQNQNPETPGRKTVIKFLPVNYPFGAYSFEIERMISAKNAVTLGVGIPANLSLMGKYGIDPNEDIEDANISTMHIRAAFRHYTGGKNLPRGFYIEPYLKYQKIDANLKASFEVEENPDQTYMADITTPNLNSLNVGFQMGVQFLIAKRVSLDLYFLGFEAGMLNGNVNAKVDPADNMPDMAAELQDAIDELPGFISNKLEVTSGNGDNVNVKSSGVAFPWLRSGISIGIAF